MKNKLPVEVLKIKPKQTRKALSKKPSDAKTKIRRSLTVPVKNVKVLAPKAVIKAKRTPSKNGSPLKKNVAAEAVESVSLPTNMSQRAIEKSVVFMQEMERHFGEAVYKIAYVSGLCFILVGGAFSVSLLDVVPPHQQGAELITTTDNSSNTTNITTDTTTTETYPKAEFQFLSSVPNNIVESTQLSFLASSIYPPSVKIIATDGSFSVALPPEKIATDKYRVVIPGATLPNNYYEVRVNLKPLDGSSIFVKRTNEFFAGSVEREYLFNHTDGTNVVSDQDTVEGAAGDSSTEVTTDTANDSTEAIASDDSTDQVLVIDNPSTVESAQADDAVVEIKSDTTVSPDEISLKLSTTAGTVLSKGAILTLIVSGEPTFVELYTRPTNALEARFVALGAKRHDGWSFTFDSNNLPNGEYEFFAKTKNSLGSSVISKSVKLTIKNIPVTSVAASTTTTETIRPPLIAVADTNTELESPSIQVPVPMYAESTELIRENAEDLNTLFEHYAVAKQTGDESLIKAATQALDNKREAILLESAQNDDRRDVADRVDSDLALKITDLKGRIDTFEELRKQRSEGATAVDSDGDGISDIDEVQLYKTDPGAVDTDNDGVTDGVEIMRGYDPVDAKSEAIIRFESPKESIGLVRKDVLVVNEVVPLIADTVTESQPSVAAEIKGRGLPNSFVTLYIFSSPTVVTVKTDAAGDFVYTFDKELDDGQHDVYVAITDNAGEIIAHSEPFSFIKQAQAFTPVAAAESAVVSPAPVTENAAAGYNLAFGVGILALGLILLMLGISLRNKKTTPDGLTENIVATDTISEQSLPVSANTDDTV